MSVIPKLILVADDDESIAASWEALLVDRGYTVRVEHDGRDACEMAFRFRPHAALLDVGMPRMSGHEIAREIRRQPWGGDVLLLAVSGWGEPKDKVHALEAGFDHHRTKPGNPDEIIGLLEGLR
jgi:two-component system, chemotaxis family, CheB/CheR fusion protein